MITKERLAEIISTHHIGCNQYGIQKECYSKCAECAAEEILKEIETDEPYTFVWLADTEWQKLLWDFKSKVGSFLSVFNCYGLGDYIPHVLGQITDAFVDASMQVRGLDHPIAEKHKPMERPTG